MSHSPFLPRSSARARAVARRRRRRLVLLLGLVLIAAGGLVLGPLRWRGSRPRPPGPGAAAPAPVVHDTSAAPARSPLGLALGTPALPLDLRSPARVRLQLGRAPAAGVLVDLASGRVLWQRNAEVRTRIASLTKMMTALLVVEHDRAEGRVLITREAVAFQGSGVGLLPLGRRVPLEAVLAGLLLPSGNDAAIALAQHVSGDVSRFVSLMNQRAAQLGLRCTRFSSPSGYYDRGNFSCATDLAELARADLAEPRIANLARRPSIALPFPIRGGRLYLTNNNALVLGGYPGITGLKTGYTAAAGPCLVATAARAGVRLAVVLLNSPNPGGQARQLLDRAFATVYHQAAPRAVAPRATHRG